ncbi:hypothetical protein JCGZ_07153 [Jatropha curcas]|uniref:Ubiquitin-like domain-containing protein n=1 Tax=Jatropha curcas TaxID=180498 RepID=A0A067KBQ6_JATCU|nr:uncharacterized protein LOC105637626 [Jatropha curcas]KDP33582.1 hypothetical protein JCGZ_07153 [Jatropha curcas]
MSLVDMRIDIDDYLPKVPIGPRRSISSALHPFMVTDGRSRKNNFSYTVLPEEPLKLSVLKLDGSCFDIEVMKSATIAELRQAVEAVFSHMPQKGPGKISWPHVWSRFCLTYDGQKLLMDTDYIRNYGIKDGDQLQFIRHISTSYTLRKKSTVKRIAAPEQHKISLSRLDIYEEKELSDKEENLYDVEKGVIKNYYSEPKEKKLAGFFQWWYQYSKMQSAKRSLKISPTKSPRSFLGTFRKIIKFSDGSQHSHKR